MTHVLIHLDAAKRMLIVKPNASKSFTLMPCHVRRGGVGTTEFCAVVSVALLRKRLPEGMRMGRG